jgi:glycine oxidase
MSTLSHIPETSSLPRVAVIGAGVVGLSSALELVRRGARVTVFEAGDGAGLQASGRAAGMIGFAFELAQTTNDALYALGQQSLEAWAEFAARLDGLTDRPIGYAAGETIVPMIGDVRLADVAIQNAACLAREIPCEQLSADEALLREPALSRELEGALVFPTDGQVEAPLLVRALMVALAAHGAEIQLSTEVSTVRSSDQLHIINGQEFDRVLLATGFSRQGVRFETPGGVVVVGDEGVVPVKGQVLALAPFEGAPSMIVRGSGIYVVAKSGRVIVGATNEPGLDDEAVDPNVISGLRKRAEELIPGVSGAQQIDAWAGIRPGTADNEPILGQSAIPGVVVALGMGRNGIMLAPGVGEVAADLILTGESAIDLTALSVSRFDNSHGAQQIR